MSQTQAAPVVSEYYRKLNAEWDELAARHPHTNRATGELVFP